MVPMGDLADVTLAIEDTDEDEEGEEEEEQDEGGPGWSAMASMCKPSISLGRREEQGEDQWLNFRSSLGYFPLNGSRSISIGYFS